MARHLFKDRDLEASTDIQGFFLVTSVHSEVKSSRDTVAIITALCINNGTTGFERLRKINKNKYFQKRN